MEILDDISYNTTNLNYYQAPNAANLIIEKHNLLLRIKGDYIFTSEQNIIIATGLYSAGNNKDAFTYYKKAYETNKDKDNLLNTFSQLTAYCFCSSLIDSSIVEPVNNYEILIKKIPNNQIDKYGWFSASISLCKAIKASHDNDVDLIVENLHDYSENFQANIYGHVLNLNISSTVKNDERYKSIREKLESQYNDFFSTQNENTN